MSKATEVTEVMNKVVAVEEATEPVAKVEDLKHGDLIQFTAGMNKGSVGQVVEVNPESQTLGLTIKGGGLVNDVPVAEVVRVITKQ